MSKTDYNSQAELITKIIDIAIKCFKNQPPKEFEENHIKQFINTYIHYKNKINNPEPGFKNKQSLAQAKYDVLIYFQEGTGDAVDSFWNEVNAQKLDIKRSNNFEKILKKGKIKNHIEYDQIIDLFGPCLQSGILSDEDINKINMMISNFESKK